MILTRVGKAVVLLIAVSLLSVCSWAFTKVDQDFSIEWFVPSDSYLQDAYSVRDNYFGSQQLPFAVYTRGGDYFAEQNNLRKLSFDTRAASDYVFSLESWIDDFDSWTERLETTTTVESDFYSELHRFLQTTPQGIVRPETHFIFISYEDISIKPA